MGKVINEEGKRYGKLTVLKRNGTSKDRKAMWLCKCDCGSYVTTIGKSLRNGDCTDNYHVIEIDLEDENLLREVKEMGVNGDKEYQI